MKTVHFFLLYFLNYPLLGKTNKRVDHWKVIMSDASEENRNCHLTNSRVINISGEKVILQKH